MELVRQPAVIRWVFFILTPKTATGTAFTTAPRADFNCPLNLNPLPSDTYTLSYFMNRLLLISSLHQPHPQACLYQFQGRSSAQFVIDVLQMLVYRSFGDP
jgi:hypothetical protein